MIDNNSNVIDKKNNNSKVIDKRNNQILVSNADREIPTLESTENGNPLFRHYPFTLGLGFHCLNWKPMLDSFCPGDMNLSRLCSLSHLFSCE